jgi:16S rRNA (cytosine1402-N4)-methyltransferase
MRSPSTDTVGAPLSAVPAVGARERQPGRSRPVGGLRMTQMPQEPFTHEPVMAAEIVAALGAVPDGILVDATLGGAGHARALLAAHPGLRLVGLDRDPAAMAAARSRLRDFIEAGRVELHQVRFDQLGQVVEGPVSAVLFDLGVSSPQLDVAARGFSYRHRGPLDMRMDPGEALTAAEVVNTYPEARLAALFRDNGEGRFAARIARAIVAARPLEDTVTLAETIRAAIPAPARRHGGHPAKRSFQAIRIEVNGELDVLEPALRAALDLLQPLGRLAVLSYHSGEDRLVKQVFTHAATGGCTCPPNLPCVCGANPQHRLVFRGSRQPGQAELAVNRRAESARLRVIERVASGVSTTQSDDSDTSGGRG